MKTKKNKTWTVKRYLIEYYEVEAPTKKEAREAELIDPNRVEVIKETIRQLPPPTPNQ